MTAILLYVGTAARVLCTDRQANVGCRKELEVFFHHQLPEQVPGVAAGKFRIVTDGECIPEANPDFQWYRDPAEYWWNGWLVS